ncbi:DUF948 domain-containing protein [bacterium]|nr:DUF948 domain-containing protein [bacterium]
METSQILLNHGLTFLVVATGIIVLLVGGFLVKLIFDISKLTKTVDSTASIVKTELEPTLKEFNTTLQNLNSIAQKADKQVNSLDKAIENMFGAGAVAFARVKNLSGGLTKGLVKGFCTAMKAVKKRH